MSWLTNAQFGKCISYADPDSTVAMPYFTLFVCSWIYFRHYIGGIIFWTLMTRYRSAITTAYGWENELWKSWMLHGTVVGLFGLLNVMNLYWLFLILKVAAKAASGTVPSDGRESEGEEETERKNV